MPETPRRGGQSNEPQWMYSQNRFEEGPVPESQLCDLIATRRVPPDALVWRAGMLDWSIADRLGEFQTAIIKSKSAPPPPAPVAPVIFTRPPAPPAPAPTNGNAAGGPMRPRTPPPPPPHTPPPAAQPGATAVNPAPTVISPQITPSPSSAANVGTTPAGPTTQIQVPTSTGWLPQQGPGFFATFFRNLLLSEVFALIAATLLWFGGWEQLLHEGEDPDAGKSRSTTAYQSGHQSNTPTVIPSPTPGPAFFTPGPAVTPPPGNQQPQAPPPSRSGYIVRVPEDYSTIQQALDARTGPEKIILRDGATYDLNGLTLRDDVILKGDGPNVVLRAVYGTGINVNNARGVRLESLRIEGSSSSDPVIKCADSEIMLQDCVIHGGGGRGLEATGTDVRFEKGTVEDLAGEGLRISSGQARFSGIEVKRNAGVGIKLLGVSASRIENSTISKNTQTGVHVEGSSSDLEFVGNTCADNGLSGLFLFQARRAVVERNTFEGNKRGINLGQAASVSEFTLRSQNTFNGKGSDIVLQPAATPTPTPTPTPPPSNPWLGRPAQSGEKYPQTRQRDLTDYDLRSFSNDQLQYAINEMMARHGLVWSGSSERSRAANAAFRKMPWYQPNSSVTDDQIEDQIMSSTENRNFKALGAERDRRKSQPSSSGKRNR